MALKTVEILEKPTVPEYIRLPKEGRCPYSGLSRSSLYKLAVPPAGKKPKVIASRVQIGEGTKSVLLINYASLMDFIKKGRIKR